MTDRRCRWGILGSAWIARKNWLAIRNAENCTLAAVASRSLERAETYIGECQSAAPFPESPRPLGSYEEMLADENIDALYIPLPTGLRKEWVVRAAEAGKHVLCEKPCGTNAGEVAEMIEACRRNGVQFMDGVMFMHSRRLVRLREVLDDESTVGPIRRIVSHFTTSLPEDGKDGNIRTHSELEPMGCLGDLGWYTIRFTLWLMENRMPSGVSARMLSEWGRSDSPAPVPMELSAEMFFDGGASSSLYCSFMTENQQWASIGGANGHIHMRDFVMPLQGDEVSFDIADYDFEFAGCTLDLVDRSRRISVEEASSSAANTQETNMFRNFAALVLGGGLEPLWPDIALKTQLITDACMASARAGGEIVEVEPRP